MAISQNVCLCPFLNRPIQHIFSFTDPAEWTASHIASWLRWCSRQFRLVPRPDPSQLPSSGDLLVALSRKQLQDLSGSRRTGRLLSMHLAHLRHPLTGRSPSPPSEAEDEEEEGEETHYFVKSLTEEEI